MKYILYNLVFIPIFITQMMLASPQDLSSPPSTFVFFSLGNINIVSKVNFVLNPSAVKKTGNKYSYDEEGSPVTDRSLRDDAFYQAGITPSYSRSGDIVVDNVTGLQWQDNLEARTVHLSWEEAKNYCASLSLGTGDWRLPSVKELQGIVLPSRRPSIDTRAFINYSRGGYQHYIDSKVSRYWSTSMLNEPNSRYVFSVDFDVGFTILEEISHRYHVRCVR